MPSTAQDDRQSDLRAILLLLKRKMKLIALSVALGVACASLYLMYTEPSYTATALILIDPAQKNLLQTEAPPTHNANIADAIVTSEVEILRSDATALATLEASQIAPISANNVTAELRQLKASTSVRRRGQTFVVAVSVTAASAEQAAHLTNTLAEVYIEQQVVMKVSDSTAARDVLEGQISAAQQSLAESDLALQNYVEGNLERLSDQSPSPRVKDFRSALRQSFEDERVLQQIADDGARALETGDLRGLAEILNSPEFTKLVNQRQEYIIQIEQSPIGGVLAERLATKLTELDQELNQTAMDELGGAARRLETLQQASARVRDMMQEELLSSALTAEALSEIYGLQKEVAIAQRQYDRLLTRMRELEVEALVEVADSRIVSRALVPETPTSPKKTLILTLAAITGTGLGVGLALLGEFYLGHVSSSSQLTHLVPAKFGTAVPIQRPYSSQNSIADTVLDLPMSPFSEAFRRLRAGIDRMLGQPDEAKVIMVTSPVSNEGKSVSALSLARTYASAGKITLLIDADMRSPTQQTLLGVKPQSGLVDFLSQVSKNDELESFYIADRVANLAVILGNRRSDVPTDQLLLSDAFTRLIGSARKLFDVIIIDTPPIVPIVDARYIAQQVDCGVICVRSGKTNQADLRYAYSQLRDAISPGASIFTLLNFSGEVSSIYPS